MRQLFLTLMGVIAVFAVSFAQAGEKQAKIVTSAADVINEIMAIEEKSIPPGMLSKAEGLVIVPSSTKVSFVVGGRRGRGIALAKDENGNWTYPVFITLTGGSVGFQVGVESTDVILVISHRKTLLDMQKGKFTLGADVSVAAGPVGRTAGASTDIELQAEIYSYSRSRGFFAGVSLDGSSIDVWNDGNQDYYRAFDLTPQKIFSQSLDTSKPGMAELKTALDRAVK